jgi:hypothetical protein
MPFGIYPETDFGAKLLQEMRLFVLAGEYP